jgi:hypothetical protein
MTTTNNAPASPPPAVDTVCPNCGYCAHCGRSTVQSLPAASYPFWFSPSATAPVAFTVPTKASYRADEFA